MFGDFALETVYYIYCICTVGLNSLGLNSFSKPYLASLLKEGL